ncbi:hypothetical protein [Aureispira anguillae]|uniref:Uncharacterized protein n=1 Tax=Aureispira anguillae TaxID=2864201 RepID=A0A916DPJ8_9BACT|nr:hypothetical protein [Aureispira anguillae]BDS10176.1 hypothetical protein AsAng_0008840 [Aureispira anguillae]
METILDDYEAENELLPYLKLRNEELADVIALLEENGVYFELKKVMGSMNDTGIVPMAATQLGNIDTIVYVAENEHTLVDVIMEAYYEEREAIPKNEEIQLTEKDKGKNQAFILLSILFLLFILLRAYFKFIEA